MIGRITYSTSLLLALGIAGSFAQSSDSPFPGLKLIEGGKTVVGSTQEEVEPHIEKEPGFISMFAGELPQHIVDVDDFYLMPTEVTNEQYAAFVRANSGRVKPPFTWGKEATEAARKAHLDAEGAKKKEFRDKGESYTVKTFDDASWWKENWQGEDWAVPAGDETKPVCRVSYYDAEAYCAWAGLRLMTEEEFQCAARGGKKNPYTWDGTKFDPEACNSLRYTEVDGLMKVGSFEKGAKNGIYDLIGNAFEWTSSKYVAFPGYEPLRIKDKRGTLLEGLAAFDVDRRVLAGGYFGLTENGCRISSRTPASRSQSTDGVGFRCAADVRPGFASADWVIQEEIRINRLRGLKPEFDPSNTAIIGKYTSEPGTAKVEGYAVITGYDRTMFTAAKSIPVGNTGDIKKLSESEPLVVGFMSFNHPLAKPALDGGTYYIAFRSGGTIKGQSKLIISAREKGETLEEDDGASRFWELPGFDETLDTFVIYNIEGEPMALVPADKPAVKNLGKDCSLEFERYDPIKYPKAVEKTDKLTINLRIPGKKANKGLVTDLVLRVEPGHITSDWN